MFDFSIAEPVEREFYGFLSVWQQKNKDKNKISSPTLMHDPAPPFFQLPKFQIEPFPS